MTLIDLEASRDHGIMAVKRAVEAYRQGKMVILVDDEDRENEGDLAMAAECITPEAVNFMVTHARGLVCLTITEQRAAELDLPPMVNQNTSPFKTGFAVSIDAAVGTTTGISASDRAHTIRVAVNAKTRPSDLSRPGHIFPLIARRGGVLARRGQTEGSVDLARLGGMNPSGVICEIMNPDGSMARMPQLREFAEHHGLCIVSIADLVRYRLLYDREVQRMAQAKLPMRVDDEFRIVAYKGELEAETHIALVRGELNSREPVLVRIHSECFTGDVLGSSRCDCGWQLQRSLEMISEAGSGVLLYVRQEGRGIGLHNKIKAYALQDQGMDTVEANEQLGFAADSRDYGVPAQMLMDLGVRRVRLMTNNPRKVAGLSALGIEVAERVSIESEPQEHNEFYLRTKRERLGHLLQKV